MTSSSLMELANVLHQSKNVIVRFVSDGGFKTITLSTSIMAEDETAESLVKSFMQTFKKSGKLLDAWQDVTAEMW